MKEYFWWGLCFDFGDIVMFGGLGGEVGECFVGNGKKISINIDDKSFWELLVVLGKFIEWLLSYFGYIGGMDVVIEIIGRYG